MIGMNTLSKNRAVKINYSMVAIVLVIIVGVAGYAFRVVTAPERVRQRIAVAQETCAKLGGQWEGVGRDGTCKNGDGGK